MDSKIAMEYNEWAVVMIALYQLETNDDSYDSRLMMNVDNKVNKVAGSNDTGDNSNNNDDILAILTTVV